MAACYDPQQMPQPAMGLLQPQVVMSCVGLLYDAASNRTFRIPDVPSTSSVAHIKTWYRKNVNGSTDVSNLVVIHNTQPVDDTTQVWQLAQGQGQFAVTVAQAKSPRAMLSLCIDSTLPMPPIPLCISSDSTVLYVKQRIFEMLNLPMALASAASTTLMLPSSSAPLPNDRTLDDMSVQNNARLSLAFRHDAPASPPSAPPTGSPTYSGVPQYQRIKEIWGQPSQAPGPGGHALLPSLLLDDEEDEEASICALSSSAGETPAHLLCAPCEPGARAPGSSNQNNNNPQTHKSRGRGGRQRSRSPPGGGGGGSNNLSADQLQHLAANFRTKSCRNGHACKFGRNCWFAHTAEELRKPTDPLPNNLPAVHKLERYSHREQHAKERHHN